MRYKTVEGQRYPAPNAKVDAFLNLRTSQRFHFNNSDFPGFNEVEQEQDKVRKELELCEIELPESTNVIEWLISREGFDIVSRLYQRALDECTEDNNAGIPNQEQVLGNPEPEFGQLFAFARVHWVRESDKYRAAELVANGPIDYQEFVNAIWPDGHTKSQLNRLFHALRQKINHEDGLEVTLERVNTNTVQEITKKANW